MMARPTPVVFPGAGNALAAMTLAAVLVYTAPAAYADMATAEKNACLNCHAVDKKMVGPAFKDIASKYKARSDAETYLSQKITQGGAGVWGAIPMPAMQQIPPAELKAMVVWILNQP